MPKRFFTVLIAVLLLYGCAKEDSYYHPRPDVVIDFAVSPDSIQVNPYGYTPLSALVSFTTEALGKTVLIVKGKHGAFTDVIHSFNDPGLSHAIPVIGMYADYANTVLLRVVNDWGDTLARSAPLTIQTGSLPADMPTTISAQNFDTSEVEPGLILVSNYSTRNVPGRPSIPFIMDDYGDIRWVLDYSTHPALQTLAYEDGISRLRNGNFYFADQNTNTIYEVDLLGKVLNTWNMPGYKFHHEVLEKPNGNFLLSVDKEGAATVEDYIIEIDRQSGSIIREWNLNQSLNVQRTALTMDTKDWIHVNAVLYDAADNTILVSGRTQGVAKLDYNNNVKWILSPHIGWSTNDKGADLNQFLLTPLDATGNAITDTAVLNGWTAAPDFEWNYYQHSILFLPNGNLIMFDNGTARTPYAAYGSDIFHLTPGKYSRAVEYKIDEANKTVQQIWSYGKERQLETYSSIISSVQFLPEKNHILFGPGFNVATANGAGGKVVEIEYNSKQVVSEISISSANKFGFHRAKKISAYPDNM